MTKIIYMNDTIVYMQHLGQDIEPLIKSGEVIQTDKLLYLIVKESEDGKRSKSSKG